MNSRPQAAARTTPLSLARFSAVQMLDGYRTGKFTPRDVIDEVIAAGSAAAFERARPWADAWPQFTSD